MKDFYGIRSRSTESQIKLAEVHSKSLDGWRQGIAYLLDTTGVDSSLFLPIFLRQRNVLNLAFWHAQILLNRPFLLNSFASLTNSGGYRRQTAHATDVTHRGELCLEAALQIVALVDGLHEAGNLYSAFWFTHYFAFSAGVIIFIYAIQRNSSLGEHLPTLQAAIKCQSQISALARPGSLSERYGVVLAELRLELFRHKPELRSLFPDIEALSPLQLMSGNTLHSMDLAVDIGRPLPGNAQHLPEEATFHDHSPSSSIAQMTGWERFDSLVSDRHDDSS